MSGIWIAIQFYDNKSTVLMLQAIIKKSTAISNTNLAFL